MARLIAPALFAIAAFAAWSLVSGAPWLEAMLPGGLPLGNALAALGLCATAGTAVALSPRGTAARFMSFAALGLATAWLPVSAALAGNLALNFGGGRGTAWLHFSLGVLALAGASLCWAVVAALLARWRRLDAA